MKIRFDLSALYIYNKIIKYMDLKLKKQDLVKVIKEKSTQYQQIENARIQLNNEILMIKGQLDLIEDMIKENKLIIKDDSINIKNKIEV